MSGLNFQEPGEFAREYINPEQLTNLLLIVFPIQHVNPAPPTKFSRPDKVDDAINVDVVTLDMLDENGQPKVFRSQLWRQSRLIQSFRQRIGGTLLGTLSKGTATMGQAPWIFISLTHDPQAVARAEAWAAANPDFKPSEPREWMVPAQQPQGQRPQGNQPGGQWTGGQQSQYGNGYQQPAHHGTAEDIPPWARQQQQQPQGAPYPQQQQQTPPLPPNQPGPQSQQQPGQQQSILERLAKQHQDNPHLQGDDAQQRYGY